MEAVPGGGIDIAFIGDLVLVESVHESGELLCIHQVWPAPHGYALQAVIDVGADAGLADLSRFCGDEDDAVGSAAAIEGGGGGVFQDAIGFYFVGADEINIAGTPCDVIVDGLTIDDDERLVAGVKGGGTPDLENDGLAGDAAGLLNFQARDLALQLLPEFRGGDILDGGAVDLTDGAGDIAFECFSIADGDLFEGVCFSAEPDVDACSSVYALLNGLVADMAEDEDRIWRGIDDIVTRRIGGEGMSGSFDLDAGSRWVGTGTKADRSRYPQFMSGGIGYEGIIGGGMDVGHSIPGGGATRGQRVLGGCYGGCPLRGMFLPGLYHWRARV